jgi:hypothetical protein
MTCADFELLLSDYVDGNVTGEQRLAFEAHAERCTECSELRRDVSLAVSFVARAAEVTPPPELITRIVYHAPRGRIRDDAEYRGFFSRTFSQWLQPMLQPRVAMGMAMTILSFAMLGRCTGFRVQEIKPSDLNPKLVWNGLEDKAYRSWDRTVKYYENLRVVYEIETRLKDIRNQEDSAQRINTSPKSGASNMPGKSNKGGTQQ